MAPAITHPSLQRQLRSATHDAHVRLNRHPLLNKLTRSTLELRDYTRILQAYWCFYQVAERHIGDCLAEGVTDFSYTERYKVDWLTQDLCHFGGPSEPVECHAFPVQLAKPENAAELIGLLYPLEGSTLGGQVISKHLAGNLGITAATGGRFFNGYASATERRWMSFLQFADLALETQGERQQACRYANHLFKSLEAFLDVHVS